MSVEELGRQSAAVMQSPAPTQMNVGTADPPVTSFIAREAETEGPWNKADW